MIQLEGDGTTPARTGRFAAPPQKGTYRKPETAIACANLFTGLRGMIFGGEHSCCEIAYQPIDRAALHFRSTLQALDTFAGRTGSAAVDPGGCQGGFDLQHF